jgi:RNA polymerase sigma factor (sigma-70 family)
MSNGTRATLLNRLRDASDPMAWDDFFRRYWPLLYTYARGRGCSEHTAEEIVQEVMLTVFEKRDVFRYDRARGRFRDWLHRVVSNRVAEHRRRPSERVRARGGDSGLRPIESPSDAPRPDAAWEAAFERALLVALLDVVRRQTNPREFVAFELTVLGERRPAEAARITGMTRNMVYKARRKVLARLRQLCGDYDADGQLCQQVRLAIEAMPDASTERSLTLQVERTMR